MRALTFLLCIAATCSLAIDAAQPVVTKAYVDDKGRVHIVTANGSDRLIPAERDQENVSRILTAPDGRAVGWLVYSSACCVSYPVPLELVVWRNDHILRRLRPGMAIWSWAFMKNGRELAFRMSPLHGGWSGESVLLDIATGKTLDGWSHPVDENNNDTDDNSNEPEWSKQIK